MVENSSYEYTIDGDILPLEEMYNGLPFFRKWVDSATGKNELEIAKKLYKDPCHYCVKIYHVCEQGRKSYIDMELLDVNKDQTLEKEKLKYDIYMALFEMHVKHNIIYIDLKNDNIGYSHTDKVWKLFDFDVSGIANQSLTEWIEQPPYYYAYRKAIKIYHKLDIPALAVEATEYVLPNLLMLDHIMYDDFVTSLDTVYES